MTLEVKTYEANSIPADMIDVKLFVMDTDELPRTPYNLESAAIACAIEAADLNGTESIVRVIKRLVDELPKGYER